jgi:hypothetical protein
MSGSGNIDSPHPMADNISAKSKEEEEGPELSNSGDAETASGA